jgi:hypothetical protein
MDKLIYFINLCVLVYPSGRPATLESTQLLIDISTRDISWGVKAADADGWQLYRLPVLNV